jgi:hypothetical protein
MDFAGLEKSKLGSDRRNAIASASSSDVIGLAENTSHRKIAWIKTGGRETFAWVKKRP